MTKEEIFALVAGREIDTLVAEKIMGECYHEHWKNNEDSFNCLKCGESRFYHQRSQGYSTDIAVAWLVLEKLKKELAADCIDVFYDCGSWFCNVLKFDAESGEFIMVVSSTVACKTAPEAICKAALLAKVKQ